MQKQTRKWTGLAILLSLTLFAAHRIGFYVPEPAVAEVPAKHVADEPDQLANLQQRTQELEQRVKKLEKELKQERKQDPVKLLTPETNTEVIIKGKGKLSDIAEPLDPNRPQGSENWEEKRFNGMRYYIVPLEQKQ